MNDESTITKDKETEGQQEDSQDLENESTSDDTGAEGSKDPAGTDSEGEGESQDEDEAKESKETAEVEFVVEDAEGDSKSQDKLPTWAKNKLKKEKGKRRKAVGETEQANAEITRLQEENHLYKRALEISQKGVQAEVKRPDHNDLEKYPDGRDDDKYQDDYDSYILARTERKNSDVTQKNVQSQEQNKARENYNVQVQAAKEKHYVQAAKLAVPDYGDTEDKAIEIFGEELTSEIILRAESPHKLLYYLGKNPKKAEEIKEDFLNDPFGASMRLGKLEDKIKVKPKIKNPTPDPDEELEGGLPKGPGADERKLDKLREKAQSGDRKDLDALFEFKKKVAAKKDVKK